MSITLLHATLKTFNEGKVKGNKTSECILKVNKSQKKYFVLDSPKKTNAGAFLSTEECPSVRFFGESKTTYFFPRFTDL